MIYWIKKRRVMMLEKYYHEVKAIVHKCRKEYYLHLWEKEDWDQEGMICLNELLENYPEFIEKRDKQFYTYFKTKFRNRILDAVRKQESYKRRLDRQAYEESYALQEVLKGYKAGLGKEKLELYERLIADERFKGRKAMLKELRQVLKDFSPKR